MNWLPLTQQEQLATIKSQSFQRPIIIFKHSTRCSISSMAKDRLDREMNWNGIDFFYLDILQYRPISNVIAEEYHVHHESPQLLLIHKGACVYDESHNAITVQEIKEQLSSLGGK